MEEILRNLFLHKSDKTLIQFIKYSMVGAAATIVDWGIFFIFESLLNINYITALIIAFMAGMTVNFILSKLWVFDKSRYEVKKEFLFFTIIGILGLIFSILLMKSMIELLKMIPIIARMVTTLVILAWNFFARKYLLF